MPLNQLQYLQCHGGTYDITDTSIARRNWHSVLKRLLTSSVKGCPSNLSTSLALIGNMFICRPSSDISNISYTFGRLRHHVRM